MALRLNIDQIDMDTPDWTCKVQIVDIGRPRDGHEKKFRFQNLILEDEEECHIRAEKLLSMTAEDIFGITCVKKQLLPIKHVNEMLSTKLFQIQLRKSSWGNSNNTNTTLSVLSFVQKEQTSPPSTTERNSKKIKPLQIIDVEMQATTTAPECSGGKLKFQPPTPIKKV